MKLWKSISPCVVFALKLGATEPSRRRGCSEVGVAYERRRKGVDLKLEMQVVRGRWVRLNGAKERMMLRDALDAIMRAGEERKRGGGKGRAGGNCE